MNDYLLEFYKDLKDKIINSDELLSNEDLLILNSIVDTLTKNIDKYQMELVEFGRLLDYEHLKNNGKTKEEIQKYDEEDSITLESAKNMFVHHKEIDHSQMFGYPANMMKDSYTTSYLRWLESKMYFMNSCGDAYHPGNYRMNNANTEIEIIELMKDNLNLPKDKYWGYINSGGTEGNFWGIREGITVYKNAVVYYSDIAHYSVPKFIDMIKVPSEKISTNMGKVDIEELITKIKYNYTTKQVPAVLLLTCGTTALGSVDNIKKIKAKLKELNIPHYIHIDAALYGGIPKNQINSPMNELSNDLYDLDIDSISISLHKYIGNSRVNGITLAKSRTNENYIDYIGQRDVTFLGSRDFPSFSTLQRIKELNYRNNENDYCKNIEIFENLLQENEIEYIKGEKRGNTFVVAKPDDEICKKYQLATFDFLNQECAHIIIFPYHTKEEMKNLVNEIKDKKKEKENVKTLKLV